MRLTKEKNNSKILSILMMIFGLATMSLVVFPNMGSIVTGDITGDLLAVKDSLNITLKDVLMFLMGASGAVLGYLQYLNIMKIHVKMDNLFK